LLRNLVTEVRRRFRNTKFGGSGHVLPDTWWNWERPTSQADVTADPYTAMGLCPIQRAVSVVSGDVARLPIQIQEYTDGRWEECEEYPELDDILNQHTNKFFTSHEWRRWMVTNMMVWGNSFSLVSRVAGEVDELIPVRPWDIQILPDAEKGGWYYRSGEYGDLDPRDVLHWRMPAHQRLLWGESPIVVARRAVELGSQQEVAGSQAFRMPGLGKIAITTKETVGSNAIRAMQDAFLHAHGGVEGMLRPIVVQNESDVKQVGQSLTDQDWIAARRFTINQVAQMYGVPPQYLYNLENSTQEQTSEMSRAYVDTCLGSYLSSIQSEIGFKLLPGRESGRRFRVWFDTSPLVRGTFSEQVNAIQVAIQSGIMTRNEARTMMGYTPLEGGDEVLIGPNMLPVEQNQEQANDQDRTPDTSSGNDDESDD
tara:strand:- start:155 stop:1429 length:1275 start_codon:yes stop_codon:yes gene_type:complete